MQFNPAGMLSGDGQKYLPITVGLTEQVQSNICKAYLQLHLILAAGMFCVANGITLYVHLKS